MKGVNRTALLLCALALLTTGTADAQKSGQAVSVRYGVVSGGRMINLQSEAPKGALIGGGLGLASAKGKKSSKKVRNSLIGAAAGSAVASSAQGSRDGMLYTVAINGGAESVQVVTDQRTLAAGDCVAVETNRDTTNLRRVGATYCDSRASDAVAAVAEESEEEADECIAAKQAVFDAASKEDLELATMKMQLLCDM